MISLYFHIPFCTQKCAYCHFYVIPDKAIFKEQLREGLHAEWDLWLPEMHGKEVVSIYFGGGTPALFGPTAICEVINRVKESLVVSSDAEITLEANPENVTLELMQAYAKAGVNRVSIGVQTLDGNLLKKLQRLHTPEKAVEAVEMTKKAGIDNISIDLMYDLPGQTLDHWEHTLKVVRSLPITHLSLYNLTIEPHTVFFKYKDQIGKQIPDAETSLQMYEKAIFELELSGLNQYEISAFAKNDYYSRHNVGYWTGRPFLGFGPSAFSFWKGKRFRNVANLSRYCKALHHGELPVDFSEQLEEAAQRRELLAIGLRMMRGVDFDVFQQRHGNMDNELSETISQLCQNGFLIQDGNNIRLTRKGVLFYDTVATEII